MIKRIIEIGNPSHLSLKNHQLVIQGKKELLGTIPIEDIGILILDNQAISYTQCLITTCSKNGVIVVLCDDKHLPISLIMPIENHTLHTQIVLQQSKLPEPRRKRLWQLIIKAKVYEQAKVLKTVVGDGRPLSIFASKVRSGDPENIEAQSARIYWNKLFGQEFKRDTKANGINALLNYGYAVLRAAVARAVVGAGLHPSLGVHHHNKYNNFCLVDDLMEPLRPVVDMTVFTISRTKKEPLELTVDIKKSLLENLTRNCTIKGKQMQLLTALHFYTASVRRFILGESREVDIIDL
ncbi:MAG: type II CRISPR-associated endonuclease Cas1 [bacterium]